MLRAASGSRRDPNSSIATTATIAQCHALSSPTVLPPRPRGQCGEPGGRRCTRGSNLRRLSNSPVGAGCPQSFRLWIPALLRYGDDPQGARLGDTRTVEFPRSGATAAVGSGTLCCVRRRDLLTAALCAAALGGCSAVDRLRGTPSASPAAPSPPPAARPTPGTPAQIAARSTVPVLCYHQVREQTAADSAGARPLICPPAVLEGHLRALAEAGMQPGHQHRSWSITSNWAPRCPTSR